MTREPVVAVVAETREQAEDALQSALLAARNWTFQPLLSRWS